MYSCYEYGLSPNRRLNRTYLKNPADFAGAHIPFSYRKPLVSAEQNKTCCCHLSQFSKARRNLLRGCYDHMAPSILGRSAHKQIQGTVASNGKRKTENGWRCSRISLSVLMQRKRKTVCCTVFRFRSYIRKTRIICL